MWHTIVSPTGREKTGYPTQKPEGIVRRIVAASSRPGGWCLDFFAGSGTLGAVARDLGRRFVLVDASPDALRRGAANAALNGLGNIEWREGDAFESLRAFARAKERFDTIVLDPPAFAKNRGAVAAALRGIALLAEAETETLGNNATGIFCECFHPFHPQCPLVLHDRLTFLEELCSPGSSVALHLLVIKAIRTGLENTRSMGLRPSSGPYPLDARPSLTYGEAWDYLEGLLALLMRVAQTQEAEVGRTAGAHLPSAISAAALHARPTSALVPFQTVAEWILTQQVPIPVAPFVDSLKRVCDALTERQAGGRGEAGAELGAYIEQITLLITRFDTADFPIRLKRFAGDLTYDEERLKALRQLSFATHGLIARALYRVTTRGSARSSSVSGTRLPSAS